MDLHVIEVSYHWLMRIGPDKLFKFSQTRNFHYLNFPTFLQGRYRKIWQDCSSAFNVCDLTWFHWIYIFFLNCKQSGVKPKKFCFIFRKKGKNISSLQLLDPLFMEHITNMSVINCLLMYRYMYMIRLINYCTSAFFTACRLVTDT